MRTNIRPFAQAGWHQTTLRPRATPVGSRTAKTNADTLIVSNRGDNTVQLFDTQTKSEIAKVYTEVGAHEFAVSPYGKQVIGSCYGSGPGHQIADNRLLVIDLESLSIPQLIDLGDNPRPNDIRFLADGRQYVVTSEARRKLLLIDAKTNKVNREVLFDQPAGHMLALSSDGTTAYVPCVQTGKVVVVDLSESGSARNTLIETAIGSEGIDISPDGKHVWIACNRSDEIHVIDTAKNQVVEKLSTDGFPFRLRFTPDGKHVFVSHPNANEVRVFDSNSRKAIARIPIDNGMPTGLSISSDGKRAYVVCSRIKKIAEINIDNFGVTHFYDTGNEPDGIAVTSFSPPQKSIAAAQSTQLSIEEKRFDFMADSDGVKIACTLTRPNGDGPFPTAIVIGHGAGMTRHGVDLELAGFLSAGVACVTYDRRGFGESEGEQGGSFKQSAKDVTAIVDKIQRLETVDASRIGISCRSRGAWVGPIAAGADSRIKFVVALAPPTRSLFQTILDSRLMQLQKVAGSELGLVRDGVEAMNDFAQRSIGWNEYQTVLKRVNERPWGIRVGMPDDELHPVWTWFANNLNYDPVAYWRFVEQPVFVAFAADDDDVPLLINKALLESAWRSVAKSNYSILEVANSNHTFEKVHHGDASSARNEPKQELWTAVRKWMVEESILESNPDSTESDTAENQEIARAIVERAIASRGGEAGLRRLRQCIVKIAKYRNGTQINSLTEFRKGKKFFAVFEGVKGQLESKHGSDGKSVWEVGAAGPVLIDKEHSQQFLDSNWFHHCRELRFLESDSRLEYRGHAMLEDRLTKKVVWTRDGVYPGTNLYFDDDTGRLVQQVEFSAKSPADPVTKIAFSDFRSVEGVIIPFTTETMIFGQDSLFASRIESVEFKKVDESVFAIPGAIEDLLSNNSGQ